MIRLERDEDEAAELRAQDKYAKKLLRNHTNHPIGDPDRIEPDEDEPDSDDEE